MSHYFDVFITKVTRSLKKRRTWVAILGALLLAVAVYFLFIKADEAPAEAVVEKATVTLDTVGNLGSGQSFSAVGTVSAVSEARLQAEAGGRITSVPVKLGDRITAGTVIATIENSAERAVLLQAQGSYEAALAASKLSEGGERNAETGLLAAQDAALSAARGAYTTASGVLTGSIDQFYSNPYSYLTGVRISGDTQFLLREREAFKTVMPDWQEEISDTSNERLDSLLTDSKENVTRMIALLDSLISVTSSASKTETLNGLPLTSYTSGLVASRTALNASLANLEGAASNLTSAREAVVSASIASNSNEVSASDAQLKIALGALRGAEATFAKTIVRSPISGEVNALYLKAGEYATPGQAAAIIANNNGLEISTSVSLEDSLLFAIGDSVTLDGVATGTITAIGAAIDPTTGKVAVKVSVNDDSKLQNGQTVNVNFAAKEETISSEISLPLSAIKMTGSGPVVFTVTNDANTLTEVPVTLGAVRGSNVVVASGVEASTLIVTDARGLKAGQEVTVSSK